jgi:chromosome segregation ATPase
LPSGDDVKLARRERADATFHRDRLREAATKLAERVEALKALEADRRLQAEHERVSAERDRLAEEMERTADPIAQIAHLVRQIEACDREIGRLNATSAAKFGHIRIVLSGAAPAVATLFQDAVVWDAFIAVAGLQPLPAPVVRGQTANATVARQRPS